MRGGSLQANGNGVQIGLLSLKADVGEFRARVSLAAIAIKRNLPYQNQNAPRVPAG